MVAGPALRQADQPVWDKTEHGKRVKAPGGERGLRSPEEDTGVTHKHTTHFKGGKIFRPGPGKEESSTHGSSNKPIWGASGPGGA